MVAVSITNFGRSPMAVGILAALAIATTSCTRQAEQLESAAIAPATAKQMSDAKSVNNSVPKPAPNPDFRATPFAHSLPLGLPEYHVRADNPMTQEKVDLGRKLFFDTELSVDRSMSCATCHDPEQGWANGKRYAFGVNGQEGNRNVPSILNAAFYRALFWDGRAGSLETQALGPVLNPDEMGMPSAKELVKRLQSHEKYPALFQVAFEDGLTANNVARALASYERTIVAGNSPYDRYMAGDKSAMSESAIRGMHLFMNKQKSKCSICHEPPAFTALFYHNLGVGMDQEHPDLGRYEITKLESNKGGFKVPTVRDVKATSPYMHDGSIATLKEVIDFYDKGGLPNRYLSKEMRGKLNLTEQEKADLLAFMVEGLTSADQPTP